MWNTVAAHTSGGFAAFCRKAWAVIRIPMAVVLPLALAFVIYLFNNPVLTWGAALVVAVLAILKEVFSTIGAAAEADAQNRYDEVHALTNAPDGAKQAATEDLERKIVLKRNYEVRSSTCGMFAVIFGVPAVSSVVNSLYPFPF